MAKPQHISFINENYPLLFIFLGIVGAFRGMYVANLDAPTAFLSSFMFYCIGVMGVLCAVVDWDKRTAAIYDEREGWPFGSPFQREGAAGKAGFGILGLLSLVTSGGFWIATVIGWSAMTFLMGLNHFIELREKGNKHMYNSGLVLWFDLFMPAVMIAMLIIWRASTGA